LDIAEACSCVQQTLAEQFENADFVFRGIVKNIPVCEEPCNQNLQVTIDVIEIFKGELPQNPMTVTVTTGGNGGLCGLGWNEEEEWMLFSKGSFAGSCGGSFQSDHTRIVEIRGLSETASNIDTSFSACLVSGTCDSNNDLCCSGRCKTGKDKCAPYNR